MLVASQHKALCSLVLVLQILITPQLYLWREGGEQLQQCPSPPWFLYLVPKQTQTWNRSVFGGLQCMVISALAALNFLKLRTLILCWNVSYLWILYSFHSSFSKITWAYVLSKVSQVCFMLLDSEDLTGSSLKLKALMNFFKGCKELLIGWSTTAIRRSIVNLTDNVQSTLRPTWKTLKKRSKLPTEYLKIYTQNISTCIKYVTYKINI